MWAGTSVLLKGGLPVRVLIVSRRSQSTDEASRIERDDENARAWADTHGHEVVALAADMGVSGDVDPFSRDGLGPWLTEPNLIASYDLLVCSDFDRISRDAMDSFKLREWLKENGKVLHNFRTGENVDGKTDSMVLFAVKAAIAEEELNKNKERQANARAKVRENGGFVGRVPFGFVILSDSGRYNRCLGTDPALRETLRELVERALRNESYARIAEWLDTIVPTPMAKHVGEEAKQLRKRRPDSKSHQTRKSSSGLWSPTSIRRVLRSPALKGRMPCSYSYQGQRYSWIHKFDSVLSAAEWDQLQEQIATRGTKRGPERNEKALLTGVIVCGHCGGPMYRQVCPTKLKNSTTIYVYYRCKGEDRNRSKCGNSVRVEAANNFVHSWFGWLPEDLPTRSGEPEPMIQSPFARLKVVEVVRTPGENHQADIDQVKADISALDPLSPYFDSRLTKLRVELTKLIALPVAAPTITERPTGRSVGDLWAELNDAGRRKYLLAAGVQVVVHKLGGDEMSSFSKTHDISLEGDPSKINAALRTIAA